MYVQNSTHKMVHEISHKIKFVLRWTYLFTRIEIYLIKCLIIYNKYNIFVLYTVYIINTHYSGILFHSNIQKPLSCNCETKFGFFF